MSYRSIHGIMHGAREVASAVDIISTAKVVPAKFKKYLLKYYAVEMSGTDLLAALLNEHTTGTDTVIHQGVLYKIVLVDTSWRKAVDAKQVVMSFRQTKHVLNCPNYVVVTIKE